MLFNQKEFAVATLAGGVESHELLKECVDCKQFVPETNTVLVPVEKKRSRINRHPGKPWHAVFCAQCFDL